MSPPAPNPPKRPCHICGDLNVVSHDSSGNWRCTVHANQSPATSGANCPKCGWSRLGFSHNPCPDTPAPAPAECPGVDGKAMFGGHCPGCSREVAALRAWKAEAQQRGAEMARRGLEIAAERDALREALEEYAGRAELQAIWHSCRACERDATIARAALKGDGRR